MADNEQTRLVLASQSPRRVELLSNLGLTFDTIPSQLDESTELSAPAEVVEFLAEAKAMEVSQQLNANQDERVIVLGADTVVVLGKDVLGKPSSREDAYQMLMRMSGRCHRVFTGVALVELGHGKPARVAAVAHEQSNVFFRSLDPAEVRAYAKSPEPMDKAGAYALQGAASVFVEKIEGCYSNIIGLPVPLTVRLLRQLGVRVLGMP